MPLQTVPEETVMDPNPTEEAGTETSQAHFAPCPTEREMNGLPIDSMVTGRMGLPLMWILDTVIDATEHSTSEYSRKKRETRTIINHARRVSTRIGVDEPIRIVALCTIVLDQARELRSCLEPGQAAIELAAEHIRAFERTRRQSDTASSANNNGVPAILVQWADMNSSRLVAGLASFERQNRDFCRFGDNVDRLMEYALLTLGIDAEQAEESADTGGA
ncbi:hypothetical protein G647_06707 [Cladophialophora carrionii CBS 160.54]|uniref:Uncharacterized protein n=1 Tax=Cladophialophora carrionii CBS 160.54 TaxID=1279043 RepID=V9D7J4_9EURO|nr:uncharacterized protein G647_06707 [Cladophialophora carrionii CBS 160.54]ETI22631.1 hypothetical protein G647_06707 [Cladophialophora carrionii CBS 160.54]